MSLEHSLFMPIRLYKVASKLVFIQSLHLLSWAEKTNQIRPTYETNKALSYDGQDAAPGLLQVMGAQHCITLRFFRLMADIRGGYIRPAAGVTV